MLEGDRDIRTLCGQAFCLSRPEDSCDVRIAPYKVGTRGPSRSPSSLSRSASNGISASEPSRTSASPKSMSRVISLGTATQRSPARLAAVTPLKESSTANALAGSDPTRATAVVQGRIGLHLGNVVPRHDRCEVFQETSLCQVALDPVPRGAGRDGQLHTKPASVEEIVHHPGQHGTLGNHLMRALILSPADILSVRQRPNDAFEVRHRVEELLAAAYDLRPESPVHGLTERLEDLLPGIVGRHLRVDDHAVEVEHQRVYDWFHQAAPLPSLLGKR